VNLLERLGYRKARYQGLTITGGDLLFFFAVVCGLAMCFYVLLCWLAEGISR